MIIEHVLGNLRDFPVGRRTIHWVSLEWYELDKRLLRKTADDGEDVGIRLDTHLHEGDVLYEDADKILAVRLIPCDLTRVKVSSMEAMGRLCFELGNRHLSLAITGDGVTVPYDEPTFLYLEKLGFAPEKVCDVFSGFIACKGHSHSHSHEG